MRRAKRIALISALSMCFGSVLMTFYLLLTPTVALASGGTADCGYGVSVSCNSNASGCSCEDGVGCRSLDGNGRVTSNSTCAAALKELERWTELEY
jgi:hypothetical protein